MPDDVKSEEPEILACPSCGVRVTVRWSPMKETKRRRSQILYIGHVIPACEMFSNLESPESYIADARAGVTRKANDV